MTEEETQYESHADPTTLSKGDSQFPPHFIQRFKQPADSFELLLNDDLSYSYDGFSQSSRFSEMTFTQMTDIITEEEDEDEDEF